MNKALKVTLIVLGVVIGLPILSAMMKNDSTKFIGSGIVIGGVVFLLARRASRGNSKSGKGKEFGQQFIARMNWISENFEPLSNSPVFTRKGEVALFTLPEVGLIEFRSTGSSYSGGSQGMSFRIAKGVSYRVGGSRGQLVKNPEQKQIVDRGSATFTNQRIVFAGQSQAREWDFEKIIGTDLQANGVSMMISVSNRQKTSGLTALVVDPLTPGMCVSLATAYREGGVNAVKDLASQYRDQMRAELGITSDVTQASGPGLS